MVTVEFELKQAVPGSDRLLYAQLKISILFDSEELRIILMLVMLFSFENSRAVAGIKPKLGQA